MIHTLKTDPQVFDKVKDGSKTFEIRKNDRNPPFEVGDQLLLKKTNYTGAEMHFGSPLQYTGDSIQVEVTYILEGPIYGLAEDWVIMAIKW